MGWGSKSAAAPQPSRTEAVRLSESVILNVPKPRGYIEALAAKPVVKHAAKSKIDTTEIEVEPEPAPLCSSCGQPQKQTPSGMVCPNGHGGADALEPGGFSEAKKGELAWQKLRSQKGWTQETQAMLLYEFIASRGLFADLIKFTGRR